MVAFAAGALSALSGAATTATTALSTGFSSLFGGAGAAATGTAAATTGGASLFSGAGPSIFATALQGGSGLVSAMGALRQGQIQSSSLKTQAAGATMDAAQQDITADQQTTGLKRQLVATLGQRDVAYASSGVDLSFGTPATARAQATSDAADAVSEVDDNAQQNKARLLQRASLYNKMAGEAQDAGDVTATGLLLGTGAKMAFGMGKSA